MARNLPKREPLSHEGKYRLMNLRLPAGETDIACFHVIIISYNTFENTEVIYLHVNIAFRKNRRLRNWPDANLAIGACMGCLLSDVSLIDFNCMQIYAHEEQAESIDSQACASLRHFGQTAASLLVPVIIGAVEFMKVSGHDASRQGDWHCQAALEIY